MLTIFYHCNSLTLGNVYLIKYFILFFIIAYRLSNVSMYQNHLEDLLNQRLLGPTLQSFCFSRFWVWPENLGF